MYHFSFPLSLSQSLVFFPLCGKSHGVKEKCEGEQMRTKERRGLVLGQSDCSHTLKVQTYQQVTALNEKHTIDEHFHDIHHTAMLTVCF